MTSDAYGKTIEKSIEHITKISFDLDFVNAKPRETEAFSEIEKFDSDPVKIEPQGAELFHSDSVTKPNTMDGNCYNESIGQHSQMKIEDEIDVVYEDVKREVVDEEHLSYYMRTEDSRGEDVKPLLSNPASQKARMFDIDLFTYPNSMDRYDDKKIIGDHGRMKMENEINIVYTEEKPFQSFAHSTTMKNHERIHSIQMPFKCEICMKYFTRSCDLTVHERSHAVGRSFQCPFCSKLFTKSGTLKVHERTHTGEKPFQCNICSKSFTQCGTLKVHERTHAGEKPFQCNICSKSFTQSSNLKVHKRTHTGEKPFGCTKCPRFFVRSGDLEVHERTHTGEKPFHCKLCPKSYAHKDNLKIHERKHTGDRPFKCSSCSKSFTQSSDLKVHERIHTGERLFQCRICSTFM
ncbi:uncharacterized protein [Leptinotarsa decemlineata]|uniref:uncharacterized protein n=1 Tax=Leptinotarsa decemlineata TaxID=7539 RepID=UPI003D30BC14